MVVAYFCIALRYNKWYQVLVSSLIAFSARTIWIQYLDFLGVKLRAVEGEYLGRTIKKWQAFYSSNPFRFVSNLFEYLWEFLICFESPLILIASNGLFAYFCFAKEIPQNIIFIGFVLHCLSCL